MAEATGNENKSTAQAEAVSVYKAENTAVFPLSFRRFKYERPTEGSECENCPLHLLFSFFLTVFFFLNAHLSHLNLRSMNCSY